MEAIISEKATRILNLLEQIDAVNDMINLHKDDEFMKDQYVYRKEEFVKELVTQLREYRIGKADLVA